MILRSLRYSLTGLVCFMIAVLVVASERDAAAEQQTNNDGRPFKVTLQPGAADSFTDAITLNDTGTGYLSPVVEAEQLFTDMLLRWEAYIPGEESHDSENPFPFESDESETTHDHRVMALLEIEIRTSQDGNEWGPWLEIVDNHDLWQPTDGSSIYWSQILYAGEDMRYWQVRVNMQPNEAGEPPVIGAIDVSAVDARYSDPADPEILPQVADDVNLAQIGKPAVLSRTAWGNPDGQGSRVPPAYYPVNHMIVHHTADPNTFRFGESSWGDRVRAIWSFHTFDRGWGDVGYNYLIDPNGVIYEGRAGGDDAVGFHDTGNYGSMGVALLGTFTSVQPTAASQNSLVSLLAWKAAQKGIDPMSSSYYYGCDISSFCGAPGAVVYNIGGHRHVTGTTCPGDQAFNLLPSIRNRVQSVLNGGGGGGGGGGGEPLPDNGDLNIDELETTFARSDANWYSASCGSGGHTFYTFATDQADESTNSATWRPNIPEDGRYRVYASIPQACGLFDPPYASQQATYRIIHAEGTDQRTVDHNTADRWVDLGAYDFQAGDSGAVELYDYPAEPYSQRKVIFFDSIKWVKELPQAEIDLQEVVYDKQTVAAGELLKVTFKLRNSGEISLTSQAPEAGTLPTGGYDMANSYVYDENECFLGNEQGSYPVFAKETQRFRLTIGPINRAVTCVGDTGGYPWRWGLNGTLEPGESREVVGYIRFREPGMVQLQAGAIEEFVRYHTRAVAQTTIQVTPERQPPITSSYSNGLTPEAQVYQLGEIPENFLARSTLPSSLPRGPYVGSFAWNGSVQSWGPGGPLGLTDRFIVEQTRTFFAPVSGDYTFRTGSDDGSWLYINGQLVINNYGLHAVDPFSDTDTLSVLTQFLLQAQLPNEGFANYLGVETNTIRLEAGLHTLSFIYFENTGDALAAYDARLPGESRFQPLPDPLQSTPRLGNTFLSAPPYLALAAGDLSGTGVSEIRYTINDGDSQVTTDGLARLGELEDGSYTVRYQATDTAGNTSEERVLRFNINSDLEIYELYMPTLLKP